MKLKIAAITNHPEHMAIYKLCFAGVGFYKGGSYEFYSHEGDYIGTAPAYRVQCFVAFMKRNFGVYVCKYPIDYKETTERPITYGWYDIIDFDIVHQWMEELAENPIILL